MTEQQGYVPLMELLLKKQETLMAHIPHGHVIEQDRQPQVIAGMGIIEETLEYLNTIGFKSWRPNPLPRDRQLEELTDILFFWLEELLLSGFTWAEVVEQYNLKWQENMERYRRAEKGDYGWDKRAEEKGL
jgi:hypothetical protein